MSTRPSHKSLQLREQQNRNGLLNNGQGSKIAETPAEYGVRQEIKDAYEKSVKKYPDIDRLLAR